MAPHIGYIIGYIILKTGRVDDRGLLPLIRAALEPGAAVREGPDTHSHTNTHYCSPTESNATLVNAPGYEASHHSGFPQ